MKLTSLFVLRFSYLIAILTLSRFLTFGNESQLSFLSLNRNLIHALLMATAFEGCSKELVHNLTSHIVVDETTGHYQNVGIVVLTDEMCNLRNPAQTGTNLLVLVQGDRDTLARATDGNARINLTTLDTLSQSVAKVRIIDTCIAPSTIVLVGITLLFEVLEHKLLKSEACVITGYANCLYFH